MKIKVLAPFLAFMIVSLTACGSNSIADGSKKMKATLIELKTSVAAADTAKVKKGADDLEANWVKFEEAVKAKDAAVYQKIEDPLHAIAAGAIADKLDDTALNKAIVDLNSALDQAQNIK
jgi:hypothetical protein